MDNKEAIRRIQDHIQLHKIGEWPHIYLREALDMAIKALEKQIPVRPSVWENRYYASPTPNDDWGYECPCCGNEDIDYPERHCECGQALDWEWEPDEQDKMICEVML